MSRHSKALNSFRLACGTASRCQFCAALLAYGINDLRTVAAAADLSGSHRPFNAKQYQAYLEEHQAYHFRRSEELPEEWKAAALSDELKQKLTPRVVKPPFVRQVVRIAKQTNARTDNRPVVVELDKSELKW